MILAAIGQNQQSDCAPSEDSDQPEHPPSLIRVFARRSMGSFFMRTANTLIRMGGCPGSSESSLHMSFCRFCRAVAHLVLLNCSYSVIWLPSNNRTFAYSWIFLLLSKVLYAVILFSR